VSMKLNQPFKLKVVESVVDEERCMCNINIVLNTSASQSIMGVKYVENCINLICFNSGNHNLRTA
jgi:hypothetical protein